MLAVAVAGAMASAGAAPTVVIYRCVGADGQVLLQNGTRCPKGMQQERRVMETPVSRSQPVVPAPVEAPVQETAPVVAMPAAPAAEATAPSLRPAPPLFACRTWNDTRYFGDEAEPPSRCAPLQTVGLDRRTETMASACELVPDRCAPVPETERCAGWAERRRTAESALEFGGPDVADAARADLARIETAVAGTLCDR